MVEELQKQLMLLTAVHFAAVTIYPLVRLVVYGSFFGMTRRFSVQNIL